MPEVKCHYEVLGVSQDVEDDVLKKAYRKLALKWHPDKNPDKVEECTKYFAIIQRAYDVLSDKQERAWYDKHREAILKGGFGGDYDDDFMDVMQYMSPAAYTGYGDDDEGFYPVYREVFDKIAQEDIRYMKDDDSDADAISGFGDSKSSYEEVVHEFYAYWQSYRTSRSFIWVEEYDVRGAPNRRVARLMEKDNKKKREAAKKAWNQQVQLLVSYVRKKDKRVQVHRKLMEEKAVEKKRLELERRERERNERAKMHEELAAQGQAAREEMEKELKEMEAKLNAEFGMDSEEEDSDSQAESSEEELNDLFCVACNKSFKSPKAFANHENSKKHKENMAMLKAEMEAEEEEFMGEEEEESLEGEQEEEEEEEDIEEDGDEVKEQEDEDDVEEKKFDSEDGELVAELEDDDEESEEAIQEQPRKKLSKKQKKKQRQQSKMMMAEDDDVDLEDLVAEKGDEDEGEEEFEVKTKLSKKQKKKRRQQQAAVAAVEKSIADEQLQLDQEAEEDFSKTKLSKKQKKKRRQQRQMNGDEKEDEEEEEEVKKDPEDPKDPERLTEELLQNSEKLENDAEEPKETVTDEDKLAAGLQERLCMDEGLTAATDEGHTPSRTSTEKGNQKQKSNHESSGQSEASNVPNFCHTCSSHFQTRNKLFKHIKSTGHALRVQDNSASTNQSQNSGKGGKRKKKHKGRNDIE